MTAADQNPTSGFGPVGDWEELGRCVFSRSHLRKAANTGVVPYQAFLEQAGKRDISVDRLNCGTPAKAAAIAYRVAAQRDPVRNFYGWAVVGAEQVRKAGCGVEDSPLPGNLYHADIMLPDSIMESRDEQEHYATTLAGMAKWRPYQPESDDRAN